LVFGTVNNVYTHAGKMI